MAYAEISIHKALAGLDLSNHFIPSGIGVISIHKALAGLDTLYAQKGAKSRISIHKALAGLDDFSGTQVLIYIQFQSTRPSRASTVIHYLIRKNNQISIHKALAGLDA